MIVITGAFGFIGVNLLHRLSRLGFTDIVIADNSVRKEKLDNYGKFYTNWVKYLDYKDVPNFIINNDIDFVFHLGAKSDTTVRDKYIFNELNLNSSWEIFNACGEKNIPIIYASSAASYGDGSIGFSDYTDPKKLKPLNLYGESKNDFDEVVLHGDICKPDNWYGLKFFNVYGYGEFHKGHMKSVILKGYNQLLDTSKISLFKSDNPDYEDGGQLRDFIYVEDVLDVMLWLMENKPENGIYNVGTGKPRTFYDLANAVINAIGYGSVEYVDMPEHLKEKYQYYTCAEMNKLRSVGYTKDFTTLEDGVADYIKNIENEKYRTNSI